VRCVQSPNLYLLSTAQYFVCDQNYVLTRVGPCTGGCASRYISSAKGKCEFEGLCWETMYSPTSFWTELPSTDMYVAVCLLCQTKYICFCIARAIFLQNFYHGYSMKIWLSALPNVCHVADGREARCANSLPPDSCRSHLRCMTLGVFDCVPACVTVCLQGL